MSWKKHFSPVNAGNAGTASYSPFSQANSKAGPAAMNYSSFLPDVYTGAPNRVDRYNQYNVMDKDSEVNAALDILAEFCTDKNPTNNSHFKINYKKIASSTEVTIIKQYLQQWVKMQDFETRMFRIVRNAFKYGDQFFLRDPETKKWLHVDPANITRIVVNESEGKKPVQYTVQNINFNFVHGVATTPYDTTNSAHGAGGLQYQPTGGASGMVGQPNSSLTNSRFGTNSMEYNIPAEHMIHLSLSEGLDNNFPFGTSLLESIYKVYKQKELLEDAVIIYRVQRAPERRVFYVDVGNMPSHLAMQFVERVKTEIHQRRIPSTNGDGKNAIDSTYNPMSIQEDFYFPTSAEGRGSRVETLPGGCFAMDTQVLLLDGRSMSIRDIENEMKDGKTLWTYSCHPKTGEVVPGLISWAGVTQKSAKVMKLTLDNGEEIICTPDHKFPQYDEDFKRADEFDVGDSLIPLYRDTTKIRPDSKSDYEVIFDNSSKEWKFTHQLVADYLKDTEVFHYIHHDDYSNGKYEVKHHIDGNRFNNDPQNLCVLEHHDHKKPLFDADAVRTELIKELRPEASSNNFKTDPKMKLQKTQVNTESRKWVCQRQTEAWTEQSEKARSATQKEKTKSGINEEWCTEQTKENSKNQSRIYLNSMIAFVADAVKNNDKITIDEAAELLNESMMKCLLIDLNKDQNIKNVDVSNGFTATSLSTMCKNFGYKSWSDFKKKHANHNHRIVEIEYLDDEIEVGTLTIDQDEVYHDYHTFALAAGVFTKNSSLGQIDDLRYFTNKLLRGLRIPSSYLPTGDEDSAAQFNDGRVGTAYIQELRFNKYCERLQNLLISQFDQEFKRYMLEKGVNIDTSMFDLAFQTPQNFAAYRQSEIDNARVPTFTQMAAIPYISNRFAMRRFLGMTEDEIAENEKLWREENEEPSDLSGESSTEMRDAGVSAAGIDADLGGIEDELDDDAEFGGDLSDDFDTTTDDTVGPTGGGAGGGAGTPPGQGGPGQ